MSSDLLFSPAQPGLETPAQDHGCSGRVGGVRLAQLIGPKTSNSAPLLPIDFNPPTGFLTVTGQLAGARQRKDPRV